MEAKQFCQEITCSTQDSLSGVCEGEMSYLEHLAKVIAALFFLCTDTVFPLDQYLGGETL